MEKLTWDCFNALSTMTDEQKLVTNYLVDAGVEKGVREGMFIGGILTLGMGVIGYGVATGVEWVKRKLELRSRKKALSKLK